MNLEIAKVKTGRVTRWSVKMGGALLALRGTQAKAVKFAEGLIRQNGGGGYVVVPCVTSSAHVAAGRGLCAFKHCGRPSAPGKKMCSVHGGGRG